MATNSWQKTSCSTKNVFSYIVAARIAIGDKEFHHRVCLPGGFLWNQRKRQDGGVLVKTSGHRLAKSRVVVEESAPFF